MDFYHGYLLSLGPPVLNLCPLWEKSFIVIALIIAYTWIAYDTSLALFPYFFSSTKFLAFRITFIACYDVSYHGGLINKVNVILKTQNGIQGPS